MDTAKEWVPVKPGLFEFVSDDRKSIQLVGSRCANCGEKHFPKMSICPKCTARELETVPLIGTGVIRTFTVVRQTAPTWKGPVPYIIVIVKLDDGVEITTHLTGCDPEKVKIGSRVRAVAGKLRDDEEGRDVIAHMFEMID